MFISARTDWTLATTDTLVTTHTIVLCHGFLGFDNIGPIEYFNGVKEELESRQCKVIVPIVPKTGSIEERAIKLDEQIESLLNIPHGTKPSVHLIGQWFFILHNGPHIGWISMVISSIYQFDVISFPIEYHHVINFSPGGWMNLQCQQWVKIWLISHVLWLISTGI